jgi:hypothetical protein
MTGINDLITISYVPFSITLLKSVKAFSKFFVKRQVVPCPHTNIHCIEIVLPCPCIKPQFDDNQWNFRLAFF